MRVIAGQLGGRLFEAPTSHKTHPMSERMRNALFNTLGDIDGLNVLDAYGGSGALAFEAISRGAESAQICETDKRAVLTIENNIKKLNLENQVRAAQASCMSWLDTTGRAFSIIFADPPYKDIKPAQLTKMTQALKPGGVFVVSHPDDFTFQTSLNLVSTKKFSAGNLSFYKN